MKNNFTEEENLFIVAIEECSEVQQALTKSIRFGKENHYRKDTDDTNIKDFLHEYYQLNGVVEMMQEKGLIKIDSYERRKVMNKKKKKVKMYFQRENNNLKES